MKLNIRGEKTKITDAMKEHAIEKLNKLNKYLENENEVTANILFKVYGASQKVEITIPLKEYTLRVEEKGKDFYAIIDTALDKLERQIRKNKTRLNKRKNKVKEDFILDFIDVEEQEEQIVKRKKINLKPMDEEEAILQMELTNHDFFFFKNSETGKTAIVYKRKENDYGLLEEE